MPWLTSAGNGRRRSGLLQGDILVEDLLFDKDFLLIQETDVLCTCNNGYLGRRKNGRTVMIRGSEFRDFIIQSQERGPERPRPPQMTWPEDEGMTC
jgi:hypothetical protein